MKYSRTAVYLFHCRILLEYLKILLSQFLSEKGISNFAQSLQQKTHTKYQKNQISLGATFNTNFTLCNDFYS